MAQVNGADAAVAARVRMYKGILGDCFLLTLEAGGRTSRILIDCGVLQGVAGAKERMRRIAADLVETCGGSVEAKKPGRLDLLVVTHEHWDHISGFSHAADFFFGDAETGEAPLLEIGTLWFAWTEKPGDGQVDALRKRFEKKKKAVSMAAAQPVGSPFAAAPDGAVRGLDGFIGPLDTDGLGAAGGKGPRTGRAILDALRDVAGHVDYLEPGTALATPAAAGAPSVHTYVLGPPRDEERLFRDLPSEGVGRETYLDDPSNGGAAIEELAEDPNADLRSHSPFAAPHRQLSSGWREGMRRAIAGDASEPAPSELERRLYDWIEKNYYAPRTGCGFPDGRAPEGHSCAADLECDEDQSYRRIDGDWLAAAGPLAMKLDSDTNNTSLVLAFELPNAEVLLFAADAQVGNWLSWHDQDYPAPDGGRVTAENILARTILYKVGHHGSHNATLKDMGLGMMTHARLVAMIPTVEAVALTQGSKGWKMPFPELKAELLVRTEGRILRGDAAKGEDADGTIINRDIEFLEQEVVTGPEDLWVEYRV